jgi:hypothetical protein
MRGIAYRFKGGRGEGLKWLLVKECRIRPVCKSIGRANVEFPDECGMPAGMISEMFLGCVLRSVGSSTVSSCSQAT